MHSKSGPSQRQIRFSEVIREIISDNIKTGEKRTAKSRLNTLFLKETTKTAITRVEKMTAEAG